MTLREYAAKGALNMWLNIATRSGKWYLAVDLPGSFAYGRQESATKTPQDPREA